MPSDVLDEMIIKLTGDASGLHAEFLKAGETVQSTADKIGKGFSDTVSLGMAKALIAVELLKKGFEILKASTVDLVTRQAEFVAHIGGMSDKLGIATETLTQLAFSAKLAGVDMDTLGSNITRMQKFISLASDETSKQAQALRDMGVSIKDLLALSPDKQFGRIADALNNVGSRADRTRLMMEVFGRGASEIYGIIKQGSEGLAEQAKEADALGQSFSRMDAVKVHEAEVEVTKLKAAFDGLGNQLAIKLSPLLIAVSDELVKQVEQWGGTGKIADDVLTGMITALAELSDIVYGLNVEWLGMKVGLAAIAVALNFAFGSITQVILSLGSILLNFWDITKNVASLLGNAFTVAWLEVKSHFLESIETMETGFANFLHSVADGMTAAGIKGANAVREAAYAVGRAANESADSVDKRLNKALVDGTADAKALGESITNAFNIHRLDDKNPFTQMFKDAKDQLDIWTNDLNAAVAKEPPGSGIKKWLAEQVTAVDAAAKEMADKLEKASGVQKGDNDPNSEKDAALKKWLADHKAALNQELLDENDAHAKELQMIQELYDKRLISKVESDALIQKSEEEHQKKLTDINFRADHSQLQNKQLTLKQELDATLSTLGSLATLMNSHSRKMFEIGKAAAIAQAVINTAVSATKAYADWGFPFGFIAAAAMIAAGAVQVAAISSTQFGGGGSSPSAPSSGGATAPSPSTSPSSSGGSAQTANITLIGNSYSKDQVRSLIVSLNDAIADGAKLNVN